MKNYREYLKRKTREFGDKFDPSDLNPDFIKYYENGKRIEVKFSYGQVKRGRIGVTTGWKPIFILLLTTRSFGSAWTIHAEDKCVKVI